MRQVPVLKHIFYCEQTSYHTFLNLGKYDFVQRIRSAGLLTKLISEVFSKAITLPHVVNDLVLAAGFALLRVVVFFTDRCIC